MATLSKSLFCRFALVLILASFQACGVAYVSPKVDASSDAVTVIPLSVEAVRTANLDRYSPRDVPVAFTQTIAMERGRPWPTDLPQPTLETLTPPTVMPSRIPPAVNPGPYQIGVGDVMQFGLQSTANLNDAFADFPNGQNSRQGYTVQDDGAITLPDMGRIKLSGLTLQEAEAALFQFLIERQMDPTFSLEITQFNAARVSLGGAVATPTVVPIDLTPLTLDEALAHAGGIATPDLDYASIRIYRDGTLYQIPLEDYLERPDLQKLRLVNGDSVFVDTAFTLEKAQVFFEEQIVLTQLRQQNRAQALAELTAEVAEQRAVLAARRASFQDLVALDAIERDYVYLTGEVAQPGRRAMPFGRQMTLADALYAVGGFRAETGNPTQIYVLRDADVGTVTALQLDSRNVANLLLATKLNLRPNDFIFIAEQPITRWSRLMEQLVPSLITRTVDLVENN